MIIDKLKNFKNIGSIVILILILCFLYYFINRSINDKTETDQKISSTIPNNDSNILTFKENEVSNIWELRYGETAVGDIYVKYTNDGNSIFSELYVIKNIDGKDTILYKIKEDGLYRFGVREMGFDSKEFGGFSGYKMLLAGNDFFVVQYLGIDNAKFSDPISVYWNNDKSQFEATQKIPEAVMERIKAGK